MLKICLLYKLELQFLGKNYEIIMPVIIMNFFILFVAFVYLVIAQRIFNTWFKLFQQDTHMSLMEQRLSWIILILGAMFWPIVVPISYITLLEKQLTRNQINLEEENINYVKCYFR